MSRPGSRIGIVATATYLPRRWLTAAEIGAASGIPEQVVVDKFGLRGKHIASDDEHVSDMSESAGRALLESAGVDPRSVDAVVYYGSSWKEYPVWQAAPAIAHRLGCTQAFALELDYVSCGTPVAVRVVKDLMVAEDELRRVLVVAASRESHLVDYTNPDSRFTYNFGDGAVAALLERDATRNEILGSHMITDGSFSHHVKVPGGGSMAPATAGGTPAGTGHDPYLLTVSDPAGMKERLDPVSLPTFVRVAEQACKRSGVTLSDLDYLCGIHMKTSMHQELVAALGLPLARAAYLDDTGHMSGVDPMLALHRAVADGTVRDRDLVLLLAAGTGYTWAASVVRWGEVA